MFDDKRNQARWQSERDFSQRRRDMWEEARYAPSQLPRRGEYDIYPTKHLVKMLDEKRELISRQKDGPEKDMLYAQCDAIRIVLGGRIDC